MTEPLSYRRIQEVAESSHTPSSAAEMHGVLAGMLCANMRLTCEHWLSALFGDEKNALNPADRDSLMRLFEITRQELASSDFAFDLLLPEEEASVSERARALGEWCQGFLFGLGQHAGERNWSGESHEVLQDFVEISRLESDSSSEDDDEAYTEIAEFVRVAVQVIRKEVETSPRQRLH